MDVNTLDYLSSSKKSLILFWETRVLRRKPDRIGVARTTETEMAESWAKSLPSVGTPFVQPMAEKGLFSAAHG